MNSKYLLALLFCVLTVSPLFAKQVPQASGTLVTDYISLLTDSERNALERKLVAYDDSTSTQIAIVIENSLEGDDIFEYSYRLAESWGIGRGGKNNGILIYVALQDRQIYIQTGYGAEGFLTDAMARRIIDQIITPAFRSQRYYRGLDETTDIIIQLGNGEYVNEGGPEGASSGMEALFVVFLIVIAIVIVFSVAGGSDDDDWDDDGGYHRRGRYDYDDYHRPRTRRRGGGWIIFPGGGGGGGWNGGGGGGFGGGGFGGFGGGGFGGGGAGGGW